MALNSTFWAPYIRRVFCREVELLHETLHSRILVNFGNVEQEAEEISKAEYDRIGSLPGGEDSDMALAAEHAHDMGLAHYEQMTGIRQGILNLFVVAFRHVFEQQALTIHRRQVLHPVEENVFKKITMTEFKERLRIISIDISLFASWPKIEELELVSNVVKHAEGRSSIALRKLRPELFSPLVSFKFDQNIVGRVYKPLLGEDVYLTEEDLNDYKNAICLFWNEFADAISQ